MKKLILFVLALLIFPMGALANGQGFESIDCNTRTGKDSFAPIEDVCIKETRILPGGDCGDPNDNIQVYVLPYKTNYDTPDGSFFYTYGRSLTNWPYYKVFPITINPDRSIFANLGKYSAGSYDIAQGANGVYTGPCLDELGSPIASAGFDVVAPATTTTTMSGIIPCSSDFNCPAGHYCYKPDPYMAGECRPITTTTTPQATTTTAFTTVTTSPSVTLPPLQQLTPPVTFGENIQVGDVMIPSWILLILIALIVILVMKK